MHNTTSEDVAAARAEEVAASAQSTQLVVKSIINGVFIILCIQKYRFTSLSLTYKLEAKNLKVVHVRHAYVI
jgi:hypothetical protein